MWKQVRRSLFQKASALSMVTSNPSLRLTRIPHALALTGPCWGLLLGLSTLAHPRGLPAGDQYDGVTTAGQEGYLWCFMPKAGPTSNGCRCASIHDHAARDNWRPTRRHSPVAFSQRQCPDRRSARKEFSDRRCLHAQDLHTLQRPCPRTKQAPLMLSIGTLTS
jgi:hypothetical protein